MKRNNESIRRNVGKASYFVTTKYADENAVAQSIPEMKACFWSDTFSAMRYTRRTVRISKIDMNTWCTTTYVQGSWVSMVKTSGTRITISDNCGYSREKST